MNRFQVRRTLTLARNALLKKFVPLHVGFGHITLDEVIHRHTRTLAKELFAHGLDVAILVLDGTYLYVQKSGNYTILRRSFCVHKHRHLIKPMMVVTTTGYVLGSYVGKNNDASILENFEEFRQWIQEDDVAAVQLLKDLGVKTEMPSFLGPKEKQFQTSSANHSRLVTKIRWVVESANGRLKNWKYLDRVIPNSQIPYVGDYTRFVAAICNKNRSPMIAGNDEDDILTAARLISMSRRENLLQARVEEEGIDHLTKSSGWALLSEPGVVPDFPKLDESDLRTLTAVFTNLSLRHPTYNSTLMNTATSISLSASNRLVFFVLKYRAGIYQL